MKLSNQVRELLEQVVEFVAKKGEAMVDSVVKFQMGHRWVAHAGVDVSLRCACGNAEVRHYSGKYILVKGEIVKGNLRIVEIEDVKSLEEALVSVLINRNDRYKHHD